MQAWGKRLAPFALLAFLIVALNARPALEAMCAAPGAAGAKASSSSSSLLDIARASQWEGTGISESSQGRKWKAKRVRAYSGPVLGDKPLAASVKYPLMGRACTKWAVVTTIFAPTDTAQQISKLNGWCAVFVGDKKSPPKKEWTDAFPQGQVVFLDTADQLKLPYGIVRETPWNHFSRKNIGFLYAVHHGAQIIYDTDDDNVFFDNGELFTERVASLESTTASFKNWRTPTHLWNPYVTFDSQLKPSGQPTFVWQRGFPLESIRDTRTMVENSTLPLSMARAKSVGVVQSVANHDPDVDGIYRLTQLLPLQFSSTKREVAAPAGVMTPFNAQAVLFTKRAFWGLLLPGTVHGRVSDIWRSYFTSRLLWEVEMCVLFTSPFVDQFRNAHDYLADFNSESALYTQAGEIIRWLVGWSPRSSTMPGLLEEMTIEMYQMGVLELADVSLMQLWIRDLHNVGYEFPPLPRQRAYRPRGTEGTKIVDGRVG